MAATEALLQFKVEARIAGAVIAEGQLVLSLARGPE
jgi:hypothetical protein